MALLMLLAELERPVPLSELVQRLGATKTTVYRLLRTLADRGALRELPGSGYVLGPAMITIGHAALRATRLREVARPHLERLRERLDETVVLSVLDGDEIVYVDRIEVSQVLGVRGEIGARLPAYCTATGHALLSGLGDDEVRGRLAGCRFEPRTANSIRSIDELLKRLTEVRDRGYALNDEELAVGHRSVSVPVRDGTNAVAAAVSISVPTARVSRELLIEFANAALIPTAAALSLDLGASPRARNDDGGSAARGEAGETAARA